MPLSGPDMKFKMKCKMQYIFSLRAHRSFYNFFDTPKMKFNYMFPNVPKLIRIFLLMHIYIWVVLRNINISDLVKNV